MALTKERFLVGPDKIATVVRSWGGDEAYYASLAIETGNQIAVEYLFMQLEKLVARCPGHARDMLTLLRCNESIAIARDATLQNQALWFVCVARVCSNIAESSAVVDALSSWYPSLSIPAPVLPAVPVALSFMGGPSVTMDACRSGVLCAMAANATGDGTADISFPEDVASSVLRFPLPDIPIAEIMTYLEAAVYLDVPIAFDALTRSMCQSYEFPAKS
jgi:hypothetical protein